MAVPLCLACMGVAGCAQDRVHPGFYGPPPSLNEGIASTPGGASGVPAGETGAGARAPAGEAAAARSNLGADPAASAAGSAGTGGENPGTLSNEPSASRDAGALADDACDLSGRWLVTLHYVTDALGQQQTAHTYLYYEIEPQDGAFVVSKGLHCGDEAVAEGLFAVQANLRNAWAGVTRRVSYAGREVQSARGASGCDVSFAKWYIVRGATYPYYADPSIPLPTLSEPANGTTPGWEDWDEDGQPGITGRLSGTVAGEIFIAPRNWTELSGSIGEAGSHFELPLHWNQEYNMLSYDGSPLLASEAVRAADPRLHFAEFARLGEDQAQGDDLEICREVVELAPTLTPRAAGL